MLFRKLLSLEALLRWQVARPNCISARFQPMTIWELRLGSWITGVLWTRPELFAPSPSPFKRIVRMAIGDGGGEKVVSRYLWLESFGPPFSVPTFASSTSAAASGHKVGISAILSLLYLFFFFPPPTFTICWFKWNSNPYSEFHKFFFATSYNVGSETLLVLEKKSICIWLRCFGFSWFCVSAYKVYYYSETDLCYWLIGLWSSRIGKEHLSAGYYSTPLSLMFWGFHLTK